MQTDRMMYLALIKLMEEFHIDGTKESKDAYQAASFAASQFELEMGPLPDWASTWNIAEEPVLFAQLYTRDGRQRGNGMIYHVADSTFGVITDMGNTSVLSREELLCMYEIGDFVLNEEGYVKRNRQNPEHIPDQPEWSE